MDCDEKCDCGMCPNKRDCACACKYEFELNNLPNNNANEATMEELKKQLKCYRFAIIELGLYLDTHPDDEKALCLHNEYAKKFKALEEQYQKVYGPLSIMYPCKKWRWLEGPWHSFDLGASGGWKSENSEILWEWLCLLGLCNAIKYINIP